MHMVLGGDTCKENKNKMVKKGRDSVGAVLNKVREGLLENAKELAMWISGIRVFLQEGRNSPCEGPETAEAWQVRGRARRPMWLQWN